MRIAGEWLPRNLIQLGATSLIQRSAEAAFAKPYTSLTWAWECGSITEKVNQWTAQMGRKYFLAFSIHK
jgi:hypothetical protein